MRRTLQLINASSIVAVVMLLGLQFVASRAVGQINLTSSAPSYFQAFDTLGNAASVAFTNNVKIVGWYASQSSTLNLLGNDGSSATGGLYSYGVTASAERALGSLGSTTPKTVFYWIRIVNNDPTKYMTSIAVTYIGEQWRKSGVTVAQVDSFHYAVNPATDTTVANYIAVNALNFSSPVNTATAAALNGNLAANRTLISGTITGFVVPPGGEIRLRFKDIDHAGSDQGLAIDSFTAAATFSDPTIYYSKSTGNLNTLSTWTTDSTGAGGSSPASFTADLQVFKLRNGNPGTLTAPLTISGLASKFVVDQTDLTITSSNAITATMDVNAGRTLTLQNTTIPTLGTLSSTSTIIYNNGVANTLSYNNLYGNIVFSGTGTGVTNPGASSNLWYAGNFTLTSTATFDASNVNLIAKGTSDQIVAGNGNTFTVREFKVVPTQGKTGKLSLATNTPMTLSNALTVYSASSANLFSDSANTLTVATNATLGGDSVGYKLTGTLVFNAATGIQKISGDTSAQATIVKANLSSVTVNSTGSASLSFIASTPNVIVLKNNFTLTACGTGNVLFNANTIKVGGNFVHTPSASAITVSTSTIDFNGTSAQTYSSNIPTTGFSFYRISMNNISGGLTLSNPMTVSNLITLTNGKIFTGSNTLFYTGTSNLTTGNANSYINGNLSEAVAAGTISNKIWPVGDNTYAPVRMTSSAAATAGAIIVKAIADTPSTFSSATIVSPYVNRYWTVSNNGVTCSGCTMSLNLTYTSATDISGGTSNTGFKVKEYQGGAWSIPSTPTTNSNSTLATGLALNSSTVSTVPFATFFGDYMTGLSTPAVTPVITAVSPLTGAPGTAVTITGRNFNTTPSQNKVYFGAMSAIPTSGSATSLTVNVPSGASIGQVIAVDLSTGYAGYAGSKDTFNILPFIPTYSNTGFYPDSINFKPKVDFNATVSSGSSPYGAAIGDLDGDGKADLVVNNVDSSSVAIFLNTNTGNRLSASSFTYRQNIVLSGKPNNIKLADIDGDGKLDIVAALSNNNNLNIIRNTTTTAGSPTFAGRVDVAVGTIASVAAITDFDGDGKADVALTLPGVATMAVLKNESTVGSISFGAISGGITGTLPTGLAFGDFNSDGLMDAVAVNLNSNISFDGTTATVFQNNSTIAGISFRTGITLTTGTGPIDVTTGDIDGDAKTDIIFTNVNSGSFSVIRSIHTGSDTLSSSSFASRVDFTTGAAPTGVTVSDINGDGKIDVIVSNRTDNNLSVFRNTSTSGSVSFASRVNLTSGANPVVVTAGDLDNDSYADLVTGNSGTNTISVFENYPVPVIGAITGGSTTICAGATTTYSDSVSGGYWSSADTAVATVNVSTGVITGVSAGSTTITYAVVVGSDTSYATRAITINPVAAGGTITGGLSVCPSTSSSLSNATASSGTVTWTISDTTIATVNSTTGLITGVSLGTTIVTFTVASTVGCGTASDTAVVSVSSTPSAGTITGVASVCTSSTTTLSSGVSGGVWTSSDTTIATVNSTTGVVTGVTTGSVVITYTVSGACGTASDTETVTVITVPSAPASISGASTVCVSGTITLTDVTAGGSWSSTNTSVATINASGVVTGVDTGSTTISYTVTNACGSAAATTTITGSPLPATPGAITGTTTLCTSATTTLSNSVSGGSWSSSATGVATIDASGFLTAVSAGTCTITYSISNSCGTNRATTSVTINGAPAAPASITGTTTLCTSTTSTLSSATVGGVWTSSDTTIATVNSSTGVVTGVAAGSATISYTVSNSCGSTSTTTGVTIITVPATPGAITGTTTVSIAGTTTLSDTTAGGSWSSSATGIATINSSGVVMGVSAGTTTISYTVTNSCGSSFVTTVVTVTAPPFTAGNLVVFMTGDSTSSAASINIREITTTGTTVNTITLPTSGAGRIVCSGSATSEGQFSLDAERNHLIIPGYDTSIGFASVGSAANINRKIYSITPDRTPTEVRNLSQTLVYNTNGFRSATANGSTYYGSGNATTATLGGVQLMAASSATKITNTATVISNARTVQIFNGQLYVATGSGTQGVYQVGTGVPSSTAASSLIHTGGTGTSPYAFSISPDSNTLYLIDDGAGIGTKKYTRTGGSGTFTYAYTLNTKIGRNIVVDYKTTPYTVYGTTATSLGTPDSVYKIIDNGASSSYSIIAFGEVGKKFRGIAFVPANTASLQLTTPTICSGASDTVIFYGNPGATINYTLNGSATSLTLDASGWKRMNTGALTNLTSSPITYKYKLSSIVTSMGTTSLNDSVTITVNPAPYVAPITGTTTLCASSTTTLSDTASGGTWSSSATAVATVNSSGVVTGVTGGTATISYSRTFTCGTGYATAVVTVNSIANAGSIIGVSPICVSSTATFIDTTYVGGTGTWSSSDTTIARVNASGVVTGVSAGSATISFVVSGSCGTATATFGVTVTTIPSAGSISGATSGCVSGTIALSNGVSGGSWTSSDTSIATINPTTGLVTGVAIGSVTISYAVSGSCGTATTTYGISIITVPATPGAITGTTSLCTSATTTLADTTAGGTWTSVDTTVATINPTTGLVTALTVGTSTISYSFTNACGTTAATTTVTVLTVPSTPASITGVTTVSVGGSSTLSSATAGGSWTSSATGVATISSGGVVSGVAVGSATITYTVTNICGSAYTTTTVNVVSEFGAGNLVVLRVNDTTSSSSLTLVEYATTGGSSISTLNLPSTGASPRLVESGTSTSEGNMSLDSERTHLIIPGYDTTTGITGSINSAAVNAYRAIFSVLPNGSYSMVAKSAQAVSYAANNFRGATGAGNKYFGAGTGSPTSTAGPRYMVGATSTQVSSTTTNIRTIQIFNGQLYYGTGSGTVGIYKVGTGIPTTTGNTSTIIHSADSLSSPYGFAISPDDNTLYVTDDARGIFRYTRTGGSGTFTSPVKLSSIKSRGLAVDFTTTPYTLYAVTAMGVRCSTCTFGYADSLLKIVDNGVSSTATVLAVAPGTSNFKAIQFTPTPNANIRATSATACSGSADTIIIHGNPGDTVNYTKNGVAQLTVLNGTGRAVIPQTYVHTGSTDTVFTYNLISTVTSIGTYALSGSTTITVRPAVTATLSGTSAICSGSSATINITGGNPSAFLTFTPGSDTVTLSGAGTGSITVSPTVTTTYRATATYLGCSAALVDSVVITVNALPTASISGTTSIFSGGSANLTFSGTPNATVIYSNGSTTDSITLSAGGTYVLTVSPTVTTVYTLTGARSTSGCYQSITGSSATVTVTSTPFANITVSNDTLCVGSSDTITISGTGGATVRYSRTGGIVDSVVLSGTSSGSGSATIIVAPSSTVTYTLDSIRSDAYVGALTGSVTITVIPTVSSGTVSGATSFCVGTTSTLTTSGAGGAWSSSDTTIASVNSSTGLVTPVSAGTAIISYTVSNVCFTSIDTQMVTINALPTASISGNATIVLGASSVVSFTGTALATVNYSVAGAGTSTTLSGAGTATITVSPTVTTDYTITTVVSTAGCSQTITGQSDTVVVLQPFTEGNLLVLKPNGSTNVATGMSILQYDTTGNLISTVTVPSTGTSQLTMSGTATSEGNVALSAERDRAILCGYDMAAGGSGVAASTVNRAVASLDLFGTYTRNISRSILSANNIRCGMSYDTNYFALGANTGIIYMNSSTTVSSTITNTRVFQVVNGQLYFSTGTTGLAGIYRVGSGIPTAGGTTSVNVCRTGTSSPYGFSISPDGNTIFVSDDAHAGSRGIRKYVKASGVDTFPATPTYTVYNTGVMGIAVDYSVTPYIIYATTRGSGSGASAVDSLLKMRDGAAASFTRLATSPTGNPFRGMSFAPYKKAAVAVAGSDTICSGSSSTVTFTGNPYGKVKYHINSGSIQTVILDSTGSKTINTGVLTTATGVVSQYIFNLDSIVTPTGAKTVTGTDTIVINPLPVVSSVTSSTTNLCVGANITLSADTLTEAGAILSYSWSGPNSFVSTAVSPVFATTTTAASGNYGLSVTNILTGCISDTTYSSTITVNALPTAGAITAAPTSLCAGSNIVLTETGTASGTGTFVSYNWSGPSSFTSTGTALSDSVVSATVAHSGVYSLTVTYSGTGCTSNPVLSDTVVVNAPPTAYSMTGTGSFCDTTGVAVGLANSQSGVTYNLYRNGVSTGASASGTGSAISFGTFSIIGSYTAIAIGAGGCQVNMNDSAVLSNSIVNVTPGASPVVCQPISSTSISYSGAVGTPTLYSVTWDTAALTAGFSNISSATLGSSISFGIGSGATGVFNGVFTVSNGTCTSVNHGFTVTVYAHPDASITSAVNPCSGSATSIIFTGTTGADISYSVDSGSTLTATLTSGSYTLGTGALTSTHTYRLIDAHNIVCNTTIDTTVTITPINMQWVGGTSGSESDWNIATNWTCGFIPNVTNDVIIPTGTTYAPVIGSSINDTIAGINLASGSILTINGTGALHIKGDVTNNGTVTGNGTVRINNSAAQTVTGIGSVNNLEINNVNGVTITGGGRLTVNKLLTVTLGTLTTNDSLVLNSDSSNTARVAPVGGNIVGQTKVVQYIPGGRRAYRFMAHPFNNYIALSQLQQYIDITGPGGSTNGFTTTGSNAASAFRYDPTVANSTLGSDLGWRRFASTSASVDSNKFNTYQGIRIFLRGAKGEGLSYTSYTPSATTLSMVGQLNIGTQRVHLTKGGSAGQDYNMVGNPYASPVNIGQVLHEAKVSGNIVGAAYYIWNPYLATVGQFQAIPVNTTSATPYYLQANASFQVRAANNNDSLIFNESHKSGNVTSNILKLSSEYVTLNIYDANYHMWDGLMFQFSDEATTAEDNDFDAVKAQGPDFNFYSISSDDKKLAIDGRPFEQDRVIPLGVSSNYEQTFIIKAQQVHRTQGGTLYLRDKMLNQYVALQEGSEYRFQITKDKASQGNSRFELSMKPSTDAIAAMGLTVNMQPNPASEEVTINYTSSAAADMQISIMDISGMRVYNQGLGKQASGTVRVPISQLASGVYMVELTSGNNKVIQRLIKE